VLGIRTLTFSPPPVREEWPIVLGVDFSAFSATSGASRVLAHALVRYAKYPDEWKSLYPRPQGRLGRVSVGVNTKPHGAATPQGRNYIEYLFRYRRVVSDRGAKGDSPFLSSFFLETDEGNGGFERCSQ